MSDGHMLTAFSISLYSALWLNKYTICLIWSQCNALGKYLLANAIKLNWQNYWTSVTLIPSCNLNFFFCYLNLICFNISVLQKVPSVLQMCDACGFFGQIRGPAFSQMFPIGTFIEPGNDKGMVVLLPMSIISNFCTSKLFFKTNMVWSLD